MAQYIARTGVTKCPPVGSPELMARGKMMDEKKGRGLWIRDEDNG